MAERDRKMPFDCKSYSTLSFSTKFCVLWKNQVRLFVLFVTEVLFFSPASRISLLLREFLLQ